ncbi:MAG: FecR family protein [Gallionella sp.]|nr:FecR family protein [Gallionella sp.]
MVSRKRLMGWLVWNLCAVLFAQSAFASGMDRATKPSVAGTVIHVQGAAFANHNESSDNLSLGAQILVGDHVVTGRNARVGLRMIDGAVLSLGADTEFAINDYRYQERAAQGTARLGLIKGVFRAVTGAIGKLKEHDFKVQTSVGTIGIRGTDFWGGFYFSQALDVALLGGKGIYIENAAGLVEITKSGEGSTVTSANELPLPPKRWGDQKLNAAKQSIQWDEAGAN